MKTEPSVIIGAIVTFVTAVIGLLVAFGIDVSDEQRDAILSTLGATIPLILITSYIIRGRVYSPQSVENIADKQYAAPPKPQPEIPGPAEVR